MSTFHTTLSRRQFMRGLGVTGASLGAASLVAPIFHDVDELIAAPISNTTLPWYVKERDLLDLTVEVDYSLMKRWENVGYGAGFRTYPSNAEIAAKTDAGTARRDKRYADEEPGYDRKWRALQAGLSDRSTAASWGFTGLQNTADWGQTPAEQNKPNWTGTPEEASRLVKAATRFFGSALVGFADFDDTYRNKISWLNQATAGQAPWPVVNNRYVYENVPKGIQRTVGAVTEWVIPTKSISMISFSASQCGEVRRTNSIMSNTNTPTFRFQNETRARLFRFLHTLGDYQLFGNNSDQSTIVNQELSMVLTGLAECSRQNQYVNDLWGGPNHNPAALMTDLVLAPTKPIDAGMWKFCWDCGICAQQCPSSSISFEKEPTYEIPLTEGMPTIYKRQGPKLLWLNNITCYHYYTQFHGCGPREVVGDRGGGRSCYAVCPFGGDRAAMAHTVIRASAANTTLFNGFFASLADVFGTGREALRPDDWWDMELPALCTNGNVGATKGQWKM